MRYYTREGSLLLRGIAYAAGTGLPPGGRGCAAALFAPLPAACPTMPAIDLSAARNGLDPAASCGLSTTADAAATVVAQYDRTIAFALADAAGVSLLVWTAARIDPRNAARLLRAVADACPVQPDGLLLTSDGGPGEPQPDALREAAAQAVREAIARRGSTAPGPAFLIYSRFGGGHWVAWSPEGCPYYPCHRCEDQRCDFCYCPLYPCGDPSLGEEVASSTAGAVWNCSGCTLLHLPAVAEHLRRNPMASLAELKRVASRR